MKWNVLTVVFLAGCFSVFAEISEDEMDRMKRFVRIESVRDATERDDDRNKIEVLKFHTSQDEQDKEGFRMRVTVELTDKSKDSYCAQLIRYQGRVNPEYKGQDRWEFHVPHGDLERPEITAYAIEYGVMDGETFVPVVSAFQDVDSVEELTGRCKSRIEEGVKLKHAYYYRENGGDAGVDSEDDGAVSSSGSGLESLLRTLKK